jgi:hypothetical protein
MSDNVSVPSRFGKYSVARQMLHIPPKILDNAVDIKYKLGVVVVSFHRNKIGGLHEF